MERMFLGCHHSYTTQTDPPLPIGPFSFFSHFDRDHHLPDPRVFFFFFLAEYQRRKDGPGGKRSFCSIHDGVKISPVLSVDCLCFLRSSKHHGSSDLAFDSSKLAFLCQSWGRNHYRVLD